jgi:hypothetical protein
MGRIKKDKPDIDTQKAENRERQQAYKEKMKQAGCKCLNVWVHESKKELVQAILEKIDTTTAENVPAERYKKDGKPTHKLVLEYTRALCRENERIQAYFAKFLAGIATIKAEKTLLDTVQADVYNLLIPLLGASQTETSPETIPSAPETVDLAVTADTASNSV